MAPTNPAAPALGAAPFQASLSTSRLSQLVPALCESSRTTGTLAVERGRVCRELTFRDGLLVAASSSAPGEHLAQVLADLRVLDVERAAEAFDEAELRGQPLGEYLVQRGLVDRPRLLEAMEQQAREAFFDCYLWTSGEARFRPGDVPPRRIELKVKPMSLHRDGLACLREWEAFQKALPDPGMTFQVERAKVRFGGMPEEQAVLDAAEAGATLQDLLELGRGGALASARRILQLHQQGALAPQAQLSSDLEGPDLEQELLWIQAQIARGSYEQAAKGALKLLDRAPQAAALFEEAEAHLTEELILKVAALEGHLQCEPLPRPLPPGLTTDDLYVYRKLKAGAGTMPVAEVLRSTAMGEVPAARCLFRLLDARLVTRTYDFL